MAPTDLERARIALAGGSSGQALKWAWDAGMQAAMRQDPVQLQAIVTLATEIEAASDGATQADARQLAAYCAACIEEPADQGAMWSLRRIFGRGAPKRKKCPDCAELIAPEAKVCRFCGFRYPEGTA